jgi:hypothetical protein
MPIPTLPTRRGSSRARLGRAAADGSWVKPYAEGYVKGNYLQAVGRLYVMPPNDRIRFCTATAVAPSVVVTAAHCVTDLLRAHFDDWFAFAPGQRGWSLPHGLWWARKALVSAYYAGDGGPTHDYAFLVMAPRAGRHRTVRLGDAVGWVPVAMSGASQPVIHLGYPATGPFASMCAWIGCYAWYCVSPVMPDIGTPSAIGIGCHTGSGSSGGPWFQFVAGRWYVTSDTSSGSGGGATFDVVWGPAFGNDALELYKQALKG